MSDIKVVIGGVNQVGPAVNAAGKDLDRLKAKAKGATEGGGMGKGLLQGMGFTALISGIRSLINSIDEIGDKAANVQFDPQKFQIVGAAAEEAGLGAEKMDAMLQRLVKTQSTVEDNEGAQQAFKRLGLSVEDVIKAKPDDLLKMIADGLQKTGEKGAIFDIFGKSAAGLIPVLNQLASQDYAGMGKGIDGIVSNETLDKFDLLDKKTQGIGRTLKSWGASIVGGIVGAVEKSSAALGALTSGAKLKDMTLGDGSDEPPKPKPVVDNTAGQQAQLDRLATNKKIKATEKDSTEAEKKVQEKQNRIDQNEKQIREAKERLDQRQKSAGMETMGEQLAGVKNRTNEEQAPYVAERILDRDFDKKEKQTEKNAKRLDKRLELKLKNARAAQRHGQKLAPWQQRILDNDPLATQVAKDKSDIEQATKDSQQAQVESRDLLKLIKIYTEELKDLKSHLTAGGDAGEG